MQQAFSLDDVSRYIKLQAKRNITEAYFNEMGQLSLVASNTGAVKIGEGTGQDHRRIRKWERGDVLEHFKKNPTIIDINIKINYSHVSLKEKIR